MPTTYTTAEAAAAAGLTATTIRWAIGQGLLKAARHGRDYSIEADDLAAYERDHKGRRGRPKGSR